MKKFLLIVSLFIFTGTLSAQDYIGPKKCKMCHNKVEKGEQYKIWAAAKHASAYELLKDQKSIDYAQENGLGNPWEEEACLKCHSTAYALGRTDLVADLLEIEKGVSCEACHGPGSDYKSKTTMADLELSMENGLIKPFGLDNDPATETDLICLTCHESDDNPFKLDEPFDVTTAWEKIAHPMPE